MKFDFSDWSESEIKARLVELRGHRAAIEAEELALVAALDKTEAYVASGSTSTASMLAHEAQISGGAAKKMVETANALALLPKLANALASGQLSSEVASEVATFATPQNEAELVEVAANWSVGEARVQARRAKAITEAEQRETNARRELKFRWNREKTMADIYGRLTAEGAVKLEASLDRIVGEFPKELDGQRVPYPTRLADALVALASTAIATDSDADRATVSLHIDYETLVGGGGNAELGGGYVSAEVARRIACDSRLQFVLDDPYGHCLGVGRANRTAPPWLARQIRHRDKCCIFPGCERDFGLEIHHIIHWADGGKTDYDNLALSCWDHHRLVHEGGWKLRGSVRDGLVYTGLWGERVEIPPWVERRVKLKRGLARAGPPNDRPPPRYKAPGDRVPPQEMVELAEQQELLGAGRPA